MSTIIRIRIIRIIITTIKSCDKSLPLWLKSNREGRRRNHPNRKKNKRRNHTIISF